MNSTPRIDTLKEKHLIGIRMKMSLSNNRTGELWKEFMQLRNSNMKVKRSELYSIQVYPLNYFNSFSLENEFEKWAAVKVVDSQNLMPFFYSFILPAGLYAVFNYKGINTDHSIFKYIYSEWIPNSEYMLDHRPHFEILGEKYKNNDPNSEEEIWIPIKDK
ncbi:MAG: GyrI-like domain-containing protein [Bacteroidota bacterium]|nr:GyrI-like domain-containing protein [Bacteroidota bacterium]